MNILRISVFTLLAGIVLASHAQTNKPGAIADFYVAPNGNDAWTGKLAAPDGNRTDGPFASAAKAQSAVQGFVKANPQRPVTVMLREGTYYLPLSPTRPGTLLFTESDSGSANAPVTWENYPGETPVISGGEPVGKGGLGLTWKKAGSSLWQVELPANTQPFEYLFYNGERRLRSRVESAAGLGYYMKGGSCYSTVTGQTVDKAQCNLGTFLRVAEELAPVGANAGCPSVTKEGNGPSKCLDRFGYNPADALTNWANLNASGSICGGEPNEYPVGDIEINILDAWTVDVMRVSCVDTRNHVIYFTGPAKGNGHVYNFFGPVKGHRYIVENTRDAFDAAKAAGQTGLWFLDRSASPWTLNYLANAGENPNRDAVVVAQLQPVSPMGGSLIAAANLNYANFRGLTFEVDNFVPAAKGFNNDYNSDDTLPEAIDCESCQHVTFDGVTVRRTSASGILFASTSGNSGPPAAHDAIENSAFYDIGDCGIRIGHHPAGSDRPANVVQFVTVENNVIQGYSRVFADGEGISQANGRNITYAHNDITDGYHAGMSICLLGCASHEANGNHIVSQYNHIWNTMQGVTSDGGTLYYNTGSNKGAGIGNKILNNLVHDTTDSSIADEGVHGAGYGGAGIYLDIQSAGIDVENNVVYNVADQGLFVAGAPGMGAGPNTINNNIFAYARKSMFRMGATPWNSADPKAQINVTNNIFYFDRDDSTGFYPIQMSCPYSLAEYNRPMNFQGNLYWRTDGKFAAYPKAFHVLTKEPGGHCLFPAVRVNAVTFLTFAQWQDGRPPNGMPPAMNEDTAGTAMVDPGFGHAGKPTDFLLSRNPTAGFDSTKTNDTIRNAGRSHPVIMPPAVPQTFPTYNFTSY